MRVAFAILLLSSLTCQADSVTGPISDGNNLYTWVRIGVANPIGYWMVDAIDPASPHGLIPGTTKKVATNSDPRSVIALP